jgi:hypothetical protein
MSSMFSADIFITRNITENIHATKSQYGIIHVCTYASCTNDEATFPAVCGSSEGNNAGVVHVYLIELMKDLISTFHGT